MGGGERERGVGRRGLRRGGRKNGSKGGGAVPGPPHPQIPHGRGPFYPFPPPLEGMGKLWGGRGCFLLDGDRIPPAHGAADWFWTGSRPSHHRF